MNKLAKKIVHVCIMLLLIVGFSLPLEVHAATKTANLVTLKETEDLTVMFRYDKEIVDMVFISPSGMRYAESSGNVTTSSGGLWKVYQIKDAEIGTWKVEYDLKSNTQIEYSIRDNDAGIWIRELKIDEQKKDALVLSFMAEQKENGAYYDYVITAVDASSNEGYELAKGNARTGKSETLEISLAELSSGTYVIQLQVYCRVGSAEVFDTSTTDEFTYTNANTPQKLDDVSVKIDSANLSCVMDWNKAASWRNEEYRIVVKADDQVIFDSVMDASVTDMDVTYPKDTKALELSLYYKNNSVWSEPWVKTLDLTKVYLNIEDVEVTGKGQIVLQYSVNGEATLFMNINEKTGEYNISGTKELIVDLFEGSNKINAHFETSDKVTYLVEKTVFFDAYPPTITLFEDINGKTIKDSKFDILGSVSDADKLLVNGTECTIGENGSFCAPVELKTGANAITLEVTDANGNSAVMSLTLYKDNILESTGFSWIYLVVGILVGALGAVVVFFLLKWNKKEVPETEAPETEVPEEKTKKVKVKKEKSEKNPDKKRGKLGFVLVGLLAVAAIIGWVALHMYVGSLEFLVLAETATKRAMLIMLLYKGLTYLAIAAVVVLVLIILIKSVIAKKKKAAVSEDGAETTTEKPGKKTKEKVKKGIFCPQCGVEITKKDRFCPNCGCKNEKKK